MDSHERMPQSVQFIHFSLKKWDTAFKFLINFSRVFMGKMVFSRSHRHFMQNMGVFFLQSFIVNSNGKCFLGECGRNAYPYWS